MSGSRTRESLAVKYRPRRLDDMIGQEKVISYLKGQFRAKIERSLLLSGPTGCGKTTLGRIIANCINCEELDLETCSPCGKCEYCLQVAQGRYPDVEELNCSDARGIDTVRDIIQSVRYASNYEARIYLLDEIQSATPQAQEALLKILEEPPSNAVFILLTTDPHKLKQTIRNRCAPLNLDRVDVDEIAKYLWKVTKLEKRHIKPDGTQINPALYKNIAESSQGIVRQALASLDAVLSTIEGGTAKNFDESNADNIREIISRFVENHKTYQADYGNYLIAGIYGARVAESLFYSQQLLHAVNNVQSTKYIFQKVLAYHRQTVRLLCDPKLVKPELHDPSYFSWYEALKEFAAGGKFYLVLQSASEITGLLFELVSHLGTFLHDDTDLVETYTLKMYDVVKKYMDQSYTNKSLFHKVHAVEKTQLKEQMLSAKKEE